MHGNGIQHGHGGRAAFEPETYAGFFTERRVLPQDRDTVGGDLVGKRSGSDGPDVVFHIISPLYRLFENIGGAYTVYGRAPEK